MPNNLHKGLCFETEARDYLERQGCQLLTQGFRCRFGEIDLIIRDETTLCFVEVKYRKSQNFGGAAYAISYTKQRKLIKTAHFFILRHPHLANQPMRFDALLIQRQPSGNNDYNWIQNAFYAE